jgi:hypothetical protein
LAEVCFGGLKAHMALMAQTFPPSVGTGLTSPTEIRSSEAEGLP